VPGARTGTRHPSGQPGRRDTVHRRAEPARGPARPRHWAAGATALERAFPVRTPAERRAASRARLRVVDEAGRRRRRRLKVAAWLVVAMGVVLMFGAAVFHVQLVQSQFRLEELDQQVAVEQQRYELLRLQVAELSSPGAIVQAAKDQLGMVEPQQTTYLVAPDPTVPTAAGGGGGADVGDPADPTSPAGWDDIKEHLAQRP
jgi:cell division protein FtsL